MEEMMKPYMSEPNSSSSSSALAMHKDSLVISKFKPKIRIIHIFAPEIIKTDVANFRELVQRLTGKPTDQKGCNKKKKNKSVRFKEPNRTFSQKLQSSSQYVDRIKEEEEREVMWGAENSSGFLSGFSDLDGFIQGFNEFPLLPLNASHLDLFGETQLA